MYAGFSWEIAGRKVFDGCPLLVMEDNKLYICSVQELTEPSASIAGEEVVFRKTSNKRYPYILIGTNTPQLVNKVRGTQVPLPLSYKHGGVFTKEDLVLASRMPVFRTLWQGSALFES
jgi:hypothetical protein